MPKKENGKGEVEGTEPNNPARQGNGDQSTRSRSQRSTKTSRARRDSALAKVPTPGAKNKPPRAGSVIVTSSPSSAAKPKPSSPSSQAAPKPSSPSSPPHSSPSSPAAPPPSSPSSPATQASGLTAASSVGSKIGIRRGSTLSKTPKEDAHAQRKNPDEKKEVNDTRREVNANQKDSVDDSLVEAEHKHTRGQVIGKTDSLGSALANAENDRTNRSYKLLLQDMKNKIQENKKDVLTKLENLQNPKDGQKLNEKIVLLDELFTINITTGLEFINEKQTLVEAKENTIALLEADIAVLEAQITLLEKPETLEIEMEAEQNLLTTEELLKRRGVLNTKKAELANETNQLNHLSYNIKALEAKLYASMIKLQQEKRQELLKNIESVVQTSANLREGEIAAKVQDFLTKETEFEAAFKVFMAKEEGYQQKFKELNKEKQQLEQQFQQEREDLKQQFQKEREVLNAELKESKVRTEQLNGELRSKSDELLKLSKQLSESKDKNTQEAKGIAKRLQQLLEESKEIREALQQEVSEQEDYLEFLEQVNKELYQENKKLEKTIDELAGPDPLTRKAMGQGLRPETPLLDRANNRGTPAPDPLGNALAAAEQKRLNNTRLTQAEALLTPQKGQQVTEANLQTAVAAISDVFKVLTKESAKEKNERILSDLASILSDLPRTQGANAKEDQDLDANLKAFLESHGGNLSDKAVKLKELIEKVRKISSSDLKSKHALADAALARAEALNIENSDLPTVAGSVQYVEQLQQKIAELEAQLKAASHPANECAGVFPASGIFAEAQEFLSLDEQEATQQETRKRNLESRSDLAGLQKGLLGNNEELINEIKRLTQELADLTRANERAALTAALRQEEVKGRGQGASLPGQGSDASNSGGDKTLETQELETLREKLAQALVENEALKKRPATQRIIKMHLAKKRGSAGAGAVEGAEGAGAGAAAGAAAGALTEQEKQVAQAVLAQAEALKTEIRESVSPQAGQVAVGDNKALQAQRAALIKEIDELEKLKAKLATAQAVDKPELTRQLDQKALSVADKLVEFAPRVESYELAAINRDLGQGRVKPQAQVRGSDRWLRAQSDSSKGSRANSAPPTIGNSKDSQLFLRITELNKEKQKLEELLAKIQRDQEAKIAAATAESNRKAEEANARATEAEQRAKDAEAALAAAKEEALAGAKAESREQLAAAEQKAKDAEAALAAAKEGAAAALAAATAESKRIAEAANARATLAEKKLVPLQQEVAASEQRAKEEAAAALATANKEKAEAVAAAKEAAEAKVEESAKQVAESEQRAKEAAERALAAAEQRAAKAEAEKAAALAAAQQSPKEATVDQAAHQKRPEEINAKIAEAERKVNEAKEAVGAKEREIESKERELHEARKYGPARLEKNTKDLKAAESALYSARRGNKENLDVLQAEVKRLKEEGYEDPSITLSSELQILEKNRTAAIKTVVEAYQEQINALETKKALAPESESQTIDSALELAKKGLKEANEELQAIETKKDKRLDDLQQRNVESNSKLFSIEYGISRKAGGLIDDLKRGAQSRIKLAYSKALDEEREGLEALLEEEWDAFSKEEFAKLSKEALEEFSPEELEEEFGAFLAQEVESWSEEELDDFLKERFIKTKAAEKVKKEASQEIAFIKEAAEADTPKEKLDLLVKSFTSLTDTSLTDTSLTDTSLTDTSLTDTSLTDTSLTKDILEKSSLENLQQISRNWNATKDLIDEWNIVGPEDEKVKVDKKKVTAAESSLSKAIKECTYEQKKNQDEQKKNQDEREKKLEELKSASLDGRIEAFIEEIKGRLQERIDSKGISAAKDMELRQYLYDLGKEVVDPKDHLFLIQKGIVGRLEDETYVSKLDTNQLQAQADDLKEVTNLLTEALRRDPDYRTSIGSLSKMKEVAPLNKDAALLHFELRKKIVGKLQDNLESDKAKDQRQATNKISEAEEARDEAFRMFVEAGGAPGVLKQLTKEQGEIKSLRQALKEAKEKATSDIKDIVYTGDEMVKAFQEELKSAKKRVIKLEKALSDEQKKPKVNTLASSMQDVIDGKNQSELQKLQGHLEQAKEELSKKESALQAAKEENINLSAIRTENFQKYMKQARELAEALVSNKQLKEQKEKTLAEIKANLSSIGSVGQVLQQLHAKKKELGALEKQIQEMQALIKESRSRQSLDSEGSDEEEPQHTGRSTRDGALKLAEGRQQAPSPASVIEWLKTQVKGYKAMPKEPEKQNDLARRVVRGGLDHSIGQNIKYHQQELALVQGRAKANEALLNLGNSEYKKQISKDQEGFKQRELEITSFIKELKEIEEELEQFEPKSDREKKFLKARALAGRKKSLYASESKEEEDASNSERSDKEEEQSESSGGSDSDSSDTEEETQGEDEELEKELAESSAKVEELTAQIEGLEGILKETEELVRLLEVHAEFAAQAAKAAQARAAEAQQALDAKLAAMSKASGDHAAELKESEADLAAVQADLKTAQTEKASAEAQLAEVQAKSKEEDGKNAALNQQVKELEEKVKVSDDKVTALQEQLATLTQEKAALIAEHEKEKKQFAQELATLKQEHAAALAEKELSVAAAVKAKEEAAEAAAQLATAHEEIVTALEGAKRQAAEAAREAEERKAAAEEAAREAEARKAAAEQAAREANDAKAAAEQAARDANAESAAANAKVASITQAREALQGQLTEAQRKAEEQANQLAEVKSESDDVQGKLQANQALLQEKQAELARAQAAVDAAQEKSQQAGGENAELKAKVAELESEKERLKAEAGELQAKVQESADKVQKSEAALQASQDENARLQAEVARLTQSLSEKKQELGAAQRVQAEAVQREQDAQQGLEQSKAVSAHATQQLEEIRQQLQAAKAGEAASKQELAKALEAQELGQKQHGEALRSQQAEAAAAIAEADRQATSQQAELQRQLDVQKAELEQTISDLQTKLQNAQKAIDNSRGKMPTTLELAMQDSVNEANKKQLEEAQEKLKKAQDELKKLKELKKLRSIGHAKITVPPLVEYGVSITEIEQQNLEQAVPSEELDQPLLEDATAYNEHNPYTQSDLTPFDTSDPLESSSPQVPRSDARNNSSSSPYPLSSSPFAKDEANGKNDDAILKAFRELREEQAKIILGQYSKLFQDTHIPTENNAFHQYASENGKVIASLVNKDNSLLPTQLFQKERDTYRDIHSRYQYQPIDLTAKKGKIEIDRVSCTLKTKPETAAKERAENEYSLDGQTINGARSLDLPMTLDGNKGPLHISLAVRGLDGQNIAAEEAVYFTAHYDKSGRLVEVTMPMPIEYINDDPRSPVCTRINGTIYTLPVDRGTLEASLQEVSRNKGLDSRATLIEQARGIGGILKQTKPVATPRRVRSSSLPDLSGSNKLGGVPRG